MNGRLSSLSRWVPFAIISALFFHITASTFTSLGVVFRYDMVKDLHMDYSQAGLGFTILALLVGLAGRVPAWTLRHLGVKATFGLGGIIMAAGFALLATATGLYFYLVGAGLAGLGYTLCGNVPGIYVINNWLPDRRSFAIGTYMTIGGMGGIVGPNAVPVIIGVTGSWRAYWWVMMGTILLLAVLAILFIKNQSDSPDAAGSEAPRQEKLSPRVFRTNVDWEFRDAVRSRQYITITAAMTLTLLCGVTMNSWAPTHMGNLGISAAFAAGALSAHQAVNSLSRAAGGVMATRIDPKWLLVAALTSEIVGMVSLAFADNVVTIGLFALGEGFGFGMCLVATAILLVNYFGTRRNPELMGTMYLITSVAASGPYIGGFVGDRFGGFTGVFLAYAVILLVVLAATAVMRPPVKPEPVSAP